MPTPPPGQQMPPSPPAPARPALTLERRPWATPRSADPPDSSGPDHTQRASRTWQRALFIAITVALLVATADGVQGRRVAGVATVGLPAVPTAERCLVRSLSDAGSAGSGRVVGPSADSFGSCGGPIGAVPIYGEIVTVNTNSPALTDPHDSAAISRERESCAAATASYLGLTRIRGVPVLPGAANVRGVRWSPVTDAAARLLAPDPAAILLGSRWIACAVTSGTGRPYTGRMRDAFSAGMEPAELAVCRDVRRLTRAVDPVPCDHPHLAEILAAGDILDRTAVSGSELVVACRRVAAQVMRRADPTAGGALEVLTDPAPDDFDLNPADWGTVTCLVTPASRRAALSDTLVGLADRPVPLVN